MHKGRVIFGDLKHRIVELPNISTTRPTSDALKEAMFNCLVHRFNMDFIQWTAIDAFAGSGALGIEALSLGSPFALFCEQNPIAYNTIRQNITKLGLEDRSLILRTDVTRYKIDRLLPKFGQKVLVILDPPYKQSKILQPEIDKFINIFNNHDVIFTVETNNASTLSSIPPHYTISTSGGKKVLIFDVTR